jgi:beta-hydroxyacyl-ACP dehydratase FabZ
MTTTLDIHQILKKLPHRYPFLMVDRVIALEKGQRIRAIKNVTANEEFFNGHFPRRPVMPGVLMLEALAQAAAILAFETLGKEPDENTVYYFAAIDGARGDARPDEGRHLQVPGARAGRRGSGRGGRADLRDALDRLSAGGPSRWPASIPPRSSSPAPSSARTSRSDPMPSSTRTCASARARASARTP